MIGCLGGCDWSMAGTARDGEYVSVSEIDNLRGALCLTWSDLDQRSRHAHADYLRGWDEIEIGIAIACKAAKLQSRGEPTCLGGPAGLYFLSSHSWQKGNKGQSPAPFAYRLRAGTEVDASFLHPHDLAFCCVLRCGIDGTRAGGVSSQSLGVVP